MKKRRRFNEYKAAALRAVYSDGSASRTRLGQTLDVRLATVTEICKELLEEGLLLEAGKINNPRGIGKKETLLDINPDGRYFLGCELFPDRIAIRLLGLKGNIISGKVVDLSGQSKFEILDKIVEEVKGEISAANINREKIFGLGFVDPGIIDIEDGRSVISTIMPVWEDVPTRSYLSGKLGMPVFMVGTSQARALAEYLFGAGQGCSNFIFIEYSKGIACGIVSEGNLVRGRNELAGEFGHFRFRDRKELCRCGRLGCLEAVASIPAVEEKAREVFSGDPSGILARLCGGNPRNINTALLVKAAASGDDLSRKILDDVREHISVAVSDIIHLLDPAKVIFDSSFLVYGEDFMINMFKTISGEVIFPPRVDFEVSKLDTLEGALGGAGLALHEFLNLGINHV